MIKIGDVVGGFTSLLALIPSYRFRPSRGFVCLACRHLLSNNINVVVGCWRAALHQRREATCGSPSRLANFNYFIALRRTDTYM